MKKNWHASSLFRRSFSLIIALVMVLSLVPAGVFAAEGTTLYLVPNENWKNDNARFAVYYWKDSSSSAWTDMTDADGDGRYEAVIPAGYSNIIFCRMNPNAAANDWNNKWNQTADLTVPTDGTNCYTVAEGTWDSGGGTWSTYSPEPEETQPTEPVETEPSVPEETEPAPAGTYYVAGVAALCGSEWNAADAANKLEWNGVTGLFEKVYPNVAAGTYQFKITDGTWDNAWGDNGQNYTFVVSSACDVTITFDPDTKTINVEGNGVGEVTGLEISSITAVGGGVGNFLNGKSWDVAAAVNHMTANGSVYTITYEDVAAGTYEVKFAANNAWNDNWGSNGSAYAGGDAEAVYNGQNIKFTVSVASDVTLTLDLTNFQYNTKNGATYAINMVPAITEPEPEPDEPVDPVEGYEVKLHFMKPDAWSGVNAYLWTTGGAIPGYSDYNNWPGKAISDADADGWYDLDVITESAFYFIFNDGSSQTDDLATGEITGDTEMWIVGNEVSTEKPLNTVTIHFQKPADWANTINIYTWEGVDMGAWPGTAVNANTDNSGWYDVTIETAENSFSFIFNDGSNQTGDLSTGTLKFKTELWVYVDKTVTTVMPENWSNTKIPVFVPGTFPGPSWDAASNQMTYDAELGLFVYTFENVPAANYEYKIAINGSWDENYGVGGVKDGGNYSVTVPQQMDVTVYYNHTTHNSVTSVNYVFADITLTGTGIPEGTKLTDTGLTGIYSVSVPMTAGTYEDIIIYMDGDPYVFTPFEVADDKTVTFFMDPVTELFYCDASDTPIDTAKVFYDSQDELYKAPFGAVAAGEEVRFSIATGEDVTSAVLVIKGFTSVPMVKGEDGLWTATTVIPNMGEYDYYFALSNGSTVAIYGDDDGYYGPGKVTDLNGVQPYDLVVYEAGYETPDWMKNAVIYQIFPDRFFDGDETNNKAQTWARGEVDYEYIADWYTLPENPEQEGLLDEETYKSSGAHYGDGQWSNEIYGGDLQGIIERIDYLKALGVNVIYLNPVFWSISNHRYDAVSYTEIDPILGTLGDFEELVAVAEANDMHIILDGVFNHVSDDSVYFDRYYKFLGQSEKIGAYPYWAYVYDYMAENGVTQSEAETAAKTYFGENYGITDYSYTEWFAVSSTTMAGAVDNVGLRAGKEVYSYEGWWGYDSMPVIYSTNGSEYQTGNWAEEIISGENSVNAYWIGKGMDGWRLDVANEVSDETWQNFRDSVKALNSEAVIIGEIWDDATKYLMGDMYDSVMNYMFRNAVTSYAMGTGAEQTTRAMEKIRERYPEEAFYAMMNLVGSHDTTRILSYLDGIGDDRNQKDFDSAFPTYEKTSQLAKNRQYLVSFLQFTYAGAPTIYYGDEIGMVGSDDPDDRRAFEWGKGNEELVNWYAKLAAIREAYPALRTGSVDVIDTGSSNLMGYYRDDILVIANNATSAKAYKLEGDYIDLVTGEAYTGTVPAMSGVILVPAENAVEISVNTADLAPAYDPAYIVAERDPNGHSHKYIGEVTTEPTCTEAGVMTYTCSCGDSYTEVIPASGHSYKAVVTKPTCTEQGYTTYTCACGESYVSDYVNAHGHHVVLQESSDPSCEMNGYEYHACEYCGGAGYTIILEATGHNYVNGACEYCGTKDPSANKPGIGGIIGAVKNWIGDWIGCWIGGWCDPEPEVPSEPSQPSEPSEPIEPSEPEQDKPCKPGWGGWFDWFWPFW